MIELASTTNPIFRSFPACCPSADPPAISTRKMTFRGVVRKTIILSAWTMVCAIALRKALVQAATTGVFDEKFFLTLLGVSAFAPFALVIVSIWKKATSPITAPLYAVLQGLFFGFLSIWLEPRFPRLGIHVFCLTCCVSAGLACSYDLGLVRVADRFNKKLSIALATTVLYVGIATLLAATGPKMLQVALTGRGVALCCVIGIFAGVTFISGYDLAARAADQNHPAYMEWYAALGLILSMVWLYLEGLRILFKDRVPNVANVPQEKGSN